MLSWKLMEATESACQKVCMSEEAAAHYGETFSTWDRFVCWGKGFIDGWLKPS